MGRKTPLYACIKKRKRHNYERLQKALEVRMALRAQQQNKGVKIAPTEKESVTDQPSTSSENVIISNAIEQLEISLESENLEDHLLCVEKESFTDRQEIKGRRIIDFQYFMDQLYLIEAHGEKFGCKLKNLKIMKEKKTGLISKFFVKCSMCGCIFNINTSEEEQYFNVNTGAISGAIITGIGLSNLNELVASVDLPTIPYRLYNKTHDTLSEMWKSAAEKRMQDSAKEEKEAAILRGDVSNAGIPMISVVADACWSKRSFKNNYLALSGVAAIIGEHTGKVLHIGVRNKYCVICTRANIKKEEPREHKCTKNHKGSSSSMEHTILVEGFKQSVEKRGLIYNTLIADGDASTYKKILESRPYPDVLVQKIECTNHLLRNYNGKNLLLQKDTTVPLSERKLLTGERLARLRTAIRPAIRYRKSEDGTMSDKIKKLQEDILNSPRHVFGDHSVCENYYCKEERKQEPNDVPVAATLMLKLQRNVSQLAYHSRSLLHTFTNNRAEQFNSIVAKMVGGKRVNFSLKDSYTARCYAAVVAFNTGKPQYTLYKSVYEKSPGNSLKRLEEARHVKNQRHLTKSQQSQRCRRKINFTSTYSNYGQKCERPDMDSEQYEQAKIYFLDHLKQQALNRHEIERSTVLQAESALWLELRRCIVTASRFSKICKRRPNQNSAPLVKSVLYSYSLDRVPAIKHGKENELNALEKLSIQENINIKKCGLFIDEELFFLGATPDGLFDNGLVEIKCPLSAFGLDPEEAIRQKKLKCFKMNDRSEVTLDVNHDWHYQVQGQLHIANKNICLFAVWTGNEYPMKVVKVYKDDAFWQEKMLPKLKRFYHNCILPELIDPRKSGINAITRNIFVIFLSCCCDGGNSSASDNSRTFAKVQNKRQNSSMCHRKFDLTCIT